MGISGLPKAPPPPPLDLAAMEERLKRFDAEREATNTWLKSTFPDLGDLLKPLPASSPVPGAGPAGGKSEPPPATGLPADDVYERVPHGYHMRGDAIQRGLDNVGCDVTAEGGIPPVGRPGSGSRKGAVEEGESAAKAEGRGGPGRKLRSFADALEEHKDRDKEILGLMNEGFAENDLIDFMRDSAAKAGVKAYERGYLDREQLYQFERDNTKRDLERSIQAEAARQKDDLERQRRDDDQRRLREDADRARRDAEEASARRRDADAQNARRDAERRDAEYRDQQRRIDDDRIRADRERNNS